MYDHQSNNTALMDNLNLTYITQNTNAATNERKVRNADTESNRSFLRDSDKSLESTSEITPLSLGLVTAAAGKPGQKKILFRDGKAVKCPDHSLAIHRGTFKNLRLDNGLAGLKAAIESLQPNQAITTGIAAADHEYQLRTKTKLEKDLDRLSIAGSRNILANGKTYYGFSDYENRNLARSQDYIKQPEGIRLMLLDCDPAPGAPDLTGPEFIEAVQAQFPELKGLSHLQTNSSSSAIWNKETGECLRPDYGHHTFYQVRGDVARFLKLVEIRGWANGTSRFQLGKINKQTGTQAKLERHIIDTAVLKGDERLIYEAGACFEPGSPLEQRRTAPWLYEGVVQVLDLDALPEPTQDESDRAAANKEAALRKISGTILKATAKRIQKSEPEKFLDIKAAKKEAKLRIKSQEKGELAPDHKLYGTDGGVIQVKDLGPQHDGMTFADPQEPDYDGGSQKAKFYWNDGKGWQIYSQAHGGCTYSAAAASKPQSSKKEWAAQRKIKRDRAAYKRTAKLIGSAADGWEAAIALNRDGYQGRARNFFYPLVRKASGYNLGGDVAKGFVREVQNSLESGERSLIAYDASKGTGKSNSAIIPAALRMAGKLKRTLIVVPTRGLAKEFCNRINERYGKKIAATHQESASEYSLIAVTCPESLYKFKSQDFELVVLDEANECIQRLESGELGNAGPQSLKAAHSLLKKAKQVILATADMSRHTLAAAQRMGGFDHSEIQIQRVQRDSTDIQVIEYTNFWQWVSEIISAIAAGKRVAIPTGSQGKGRMLDRFLHDLFPEKQGLDIDGKATLSTIREKFLRNPDEFLETMKPDWFIFSPVINSGVSIEGAHFDSQFEYITPHEAAQSASQRGERIRSAIGRDGAIAHRHVYFSTVGAPTLEAYPEALDPAYWVEELANRENAPIRAAAALAKALGASKAIDPIKQDMSALAGLRPELPDFMAVGAFDILFKREILRDEWRGYGWEISDAPKPQPEQVAEFENLKLVSEDITIGICRQVGRTMKKARGIEALDNGDIAGPIQAVKVRRGKLDALLGKEFLDQQDDEFFTAWFADKTAANPGMKSIVRSQLLKMAVETPDAFAEIERAKALRLLAGKADGSKGEHWNLPELPAPAKDIELVSILRRCPGIEEVYTGELTSWTNKHKLVVHAGMWLIAHGPQIAANTKRVGLTRGAVFSEQMAPAALFNKALELCGLEAQKEGRQGKGARQNEYRLKVAADVEAKLVGLLASEEPPTRMQIFRAESAATRARTRSAVNEAAYSMIVGRLATWLDAEGDQASAIAAIKKRHSNLINSSSTEVGDGARKGAEIGGDGLAQRSFMGVRESEPPPQATGF